MKTTTILYLAVLLSVVISLATCSVESICYPSLVDGKKQHCYSTAVPFEDVPLPEDPRVIGPLYHLFRRVGNQTTSRLINDSHLLSNRNGDLVVLIHGWMNTFNNSEEWHMPIVNNLLKIMVTFFLIKKNEI